MQVLLLRIRGGRWQRGVQRRSALCEVPEAGEGTADLGGREDRVWAGSAWLWEARDEPDKVWHPRPRLIMRERQSH